jgi:hypothetical protein
MSLVVTYKIASSTYIAILGVHAKQFRVSDYYLRDSVCFCQMWSYILVDFLLLSHRKGRVNKIIQKNSKFLQNLVRLFQLAVFAQSPKTYS